MTPTERRILAAARREYANVNKYARAEVAHALRNDGRSVFTATLDELYRACAADAAAKKRKPRAPKWKPETPSPYDLSERRKR